MDRVINDGVFIQAKGQVVAFIAFDDEPVVAPLVACFLQNVVAQRFGLLGCQQIFKKGDPVPLDHFYRIGNIGTRWSAQFLVRCGRDHVGPALAVRIDLLSFVPLDLDLEEVLGEQKAAEKGAQRQPQDDKSAIRGRH